MVALCGGYGFVFDGFPRTLPQAQSLQEILQRHHTPLDLAIWLEVSEETVRDRIGSRLQCRGCGFTTSVSSAKFSERPVCPFCDGPLVRRNDDDPEVLQKRLLEFNAKTQPLADFYGKISALNRIDGNRDREEVFSDISRLIEQKTAKEVEQMRRACRTASDILERVSELVRPGVTTKEVDEAAADFMQEARVKSAFLGYRLGHRVFPGNICISLNDEVVHGIASQRRIQYGDVVKLDIGVVQDGWVGDTATTVPVGMVDGRLDELLRVTESALQRAIDQATEGARLGDVCAEIEDEALRHRFSVVREFVGHGVGRKLHEEPQIPNYGKRGSGPRLKSGMTLAIEPMVNLGAAAVRLLEDGWTVRTADGMPSAHFEHTVLITKEEPEILTWRAKTQLK